MNLPLRLERIEMVVETGEFATKSMRSATGNFVREGGLEPPNPKAPRPKRGVFANFTTRARSIAYATALLALAHRFRPAQLAVWLWQFGHRNRTFVRRLSR
jgi:hypothetical protein